MLDTGYWMLDSLSVGIQYLVSSTKSIFFGADKQISIYRYFTDVQLKFLLDLFLYIWDLCNPPTCGVSLLKINYWNQPIWKEKLK